MISLHPRPPSPLPSLHAQNLPQSAWKNNYSVRFIPSPYLPLEPNQGKHLSVKKSLFKQKSSDKHPKFHQKSNILFAPPPAVKLICQNHIIKMRKSRWGQCTTSDNSTFLEPQRCIVFAQPQIPGLRKHQELHRHLTRGSFWASRGAPATPEDHELVFWKVQHMSSWLLQSVLRRRFGEQGVCL